MVVADLAVATCVTELLHRPRYEVMLLEGAEEQVSAHVPLEVVASEKVGGFHVFTFNDLEDTEAWRRRRLDTR